jgi:hypothetical protein
VKPFASRKQATLIHAQVTGGRGDMADENRDEFTTVPIPSSETDEEHRRIRESNDRDQRLEREGKPARHNRGYDEAADGNQPPLHIEDVVNED